MTFSFSLKKKFTKLATFLLVVSNVGFFASSVQARTYLSPETLPNGRVGIHYSQEIRSSVPLGYDWTRTGDLPEGLTGTVSPDGVTYKIEGNPTRHSIREFHLDTVRRDGGVGDSPSGDFTLAIDPVEISTSSSLPHARVSLPYSQTFSVIGGTSPYTWGRRSGPLPEGLTLEPTTGIISGRPTEAGEFTFTLSSTDAVIVHAEKTFTLVVDPAPVTSPLTISNDATLPSARVGTAYSVDLVATGGSTPYRWSVLSGSTLPPGMTLTTASDAGQLRGTPTTAGTFSFGVKLLEAGDSSITKTFTVVVAPRSVTTIPIDSVIVAPVTPVTGVTIGTTVVPSGIVGTTYSTTLTANGGTAPYRWNFASGTLPPGLTLSTDGTISGRPTTAGTYSAYIEAFDASGAFVGRSFTFGIAAATLVIPTTPITVTTPVASAELTTRLNNLAAQGISINSLVKLPDDGNRFTQADSAVYYIGADGRRHAFPNDRVFFTWYGNFDGVRVVSSGALASIPLGANATYKPGTKMVKFATDPKVYALSNNRTLRWVKTEAAAQALYGSSWNRNIDDIADTFYIDYNFGADVNSASDYDRTGLQSSIRLVSDVLPL